MKKVGISLSKDSFSLGILNFFEVSAVSKKAIFRSSLQASLSWEIEKWSSISGHFLNG